MMKPASNYARALALALTVGLLAPSAFAFAETGASVNIKTRVTAELNAKFCEGIGTLSTNIVSRVPKREDRRDTTLAAKTQKVDDRLKVRVTKLEDHRDQWDENRIDRYAKLEARATTDAQVAAVATFKAKVDAAVEVRRAAVDKAVTAFQNGVNALLADRQTKLDNAFAALKTATDAATAKAKADCAAGKSAADVRVQLKADIASANEAFRKATQPSSELERQLHALRETRDAAVKTAIDAFNRAFNAAFVELKAAFAVN